MIILVWIRYGTVLNTCRVIPVDPCRIQLQWMSAPFFHLFYLPTGTYICRNTKSTPHVENTSKIVSKVRVDEPVDRMSTFWVAVNFRMAISKVQKVPVRPMPKKSPEISTGNYLRYWAFFVSKRLSHEIVGIFSSCKGRSFLCEPQGKSPTNRKFPTVFRINIGQMRIPDPVLSAMRISYPDPGFKKTCPGNVLLKKSTNFWYSKSNLWTLMVDRSRLGKSC